MINHSRGASLLNETNYAKPAEIDEKNREQNKSKQNKTR
jgi:hypothetical protein